MLMWFDVGWLSGERRFGECDTESDSISPRYPVYIAVHRDSLTMTLRHCTQRASQDDDLLPPADLPLFSPLDPASTWPNFPGVPELHRRHEPISRGYQIGGDRCQHAEVSALSTKKARISPQRVPDQFKGSLLGTVFRAPPEQPTAKMSRDVM
jgi:hypothetical protein